MKIFIDLKIQTISKRKSWFSNEKVDEHKIVGLAVLNENNQGFKCWSTDFDEHSFIKTKWGKNVYDYNYLKKRQKITNDEMFVQLKRFIGNPETLTVISSNINENAGNIGNAIFHLIFGSKLDIQSIEYIDLQSILYKEEQNLSHLEAPNTFQCFDPMARATWVWHEYTKLIKRIDERNLVKFEMVAQDSHKGLLEYMSSKASYNDSGDIVIPKNNFDNWMKKSTKPYFTLDKNQKHQYVFEACKYLNALNNGKSVN